MAAAVGNRNILVGRPCMSLSTITPAWPSLASSPIRRPIPPSPSSGMRLTSSPATASPSALCSPITAVAIAPITFAKLVSRWASNTVALALTRRKPMAKPNASSRPPCANGPTLLTGPTPSKETTPSLLGPTTTTMPVLMVAFTTSRPSAAPNQVQPLDHLQVPPPISPQSIQSKLVNSTVFKNKDLAMRHVDFGAILEKILLRDSLLQRRFFKDLKLVWAGLRTVSGDGHTSSLANPDR